ncbi:hypothetical protein Caci_0493 [Catenulispora acidiphila DSM 44928]|uniref:NACHT domain-containing protein n=1 Tax=Catenulispora acidiphila (strain DSM 44928 / JCM 14897 / NBRC 102108 / NRRL B-24433 / ID139908) TaxID=479433 RepID=C7PX92_CATAD|nr:NACHT domain-containing protein [Catenulispora acidiphila]ACU69443.1 hypothetical protein Caci_0493 [Catenulispora acidiphila DSM 44928]
MKGSIITFYSYKGGTGRSMALANAAWILASNGLRVLVVDWDLEAPGLHRYFHPFLSDRDLRTSMGLIDLVWEFVAAALDSEAQDEPGWHEDFARISPYAMSIDFDFPGRGTVDLVPAGKQDASYSALVSSFDWGNFYERLGGGGYLEALKRDMRLHYDYVLIDSRTGLSDTAGICTVHLPDILVNCFSLSTQAIDGAAAVAGSVHRQRENRQVRIFPVPMRVEDGEQDKLDASRDFARERFGRFLFHVSDPERYWGEVEVPYKSFYAYEEILATFGDRPQQENSVLAATERIVGYLSDGQVTALSSSLSESERRVWLTRFQRNGPKLSRTELDVRLPGPPLKIFISYAHDSHEHFEEVRELWFLLRANGTDAQLGSPDNERRWNGPVPTATEIRTADLIIVAVSPLYRRSTGDDGQTSGDESGAGVEARLIRDEVQGGYSVQRIIPVVLPSAAVTEVPAYLADSPVRPVIVEQLTADGIRPLLRQVARFKRVDHKRADFNPSWRENLPKPEPDLEQAALQLARSVASGWEVSAAATLSRPPLATRWSGSQRRGSFDDLVNIFLTSSRGRLLVLGSAGSGKTTTAVRLLLDLLARRTDEPIPILLAVATWRPDVEHINTWIIRRLQEDYTVGGIAERLVTTGMILPILDGLDELPVTQRALALDALSTLRINQPFVATCRTGDYRQVAAELGQMLANTVVVELEPITSNDIRAYLAVDLPDSDRRWQPVFAHLREFPGGLLAQSMSNPFMLDLMRDAYRRPNTDPAELLNNRLFPTTQAIEHRLFGTFIGRAYAPRPSTRPESTYDASSADRWLSFLARSLHEQHTRDLSWWHLHRVLPPGGLRTLLALAAGFFGALMLGLAGLRFDVLPDIAAIPGWVKGALAGTGLGLFVALVAREPVQLSKPSPRRAEPSPRRRQLGRLVGISADLNQASSPAAALLIERRTVSTVGLLMVLVIGISELVSGIPRALVEPIVATAVGLIMVRFSTSSWGWYSVTRWWLALRGVLPLRVMRFLGDAHARGVLRQQGVAYQFRDVALLEWFAGDHI